MSTKRIFVSGALGFQGKSIAELLVKNGYEVQTLSRNTDPNSITKGSFKITKGSLEVIDDVREALKEIDKAVFTLPLVFDKNQAVQMTQNFIEAAKSEGIKQVVFNTGFDLPIKEEGLVAMDIKVLMKKMFDDSGLAVTTVVPDIYIDNLIAPWSLPLIMDQAILPYPVKNGQKVPWISHYDLAKFVVSAIEKPELTGQVLPIGGNLYTGEEIAMAISEKIGKNIQFIGLTPDDFEKNLAPSFGPVAAKEISNLYRYVDTHIESLTNKDFKGAQEKLMMQTQSLSDWVESVQWN